MSYSVRLRPSARRGLRRLRRSAQERVAKALLALQGNPRPPGCKKLRAGLGWSLRIGGYRIIYDVDDSERTVTVRYIGPRAGAYKL